MVCNEGKYFVIGRTPEIESNPKALILDSAECLDSTLARPFS